MIRGVAWSVLLFCLLGLGVGSAAASAAGPTEAAAAAAHEAEESEAKVQVHSHTAFSFKRPHGQAPPVERARRASRALQDSIAEGEQGEVEFELAGDVARFRIGKRMLFDLTTADAQAEGEPSLERFAEMRRSQLETFLQEERRRASLQNVVLSICLAVSLVFMGFLLMRGIWRWRKRFQEWLEAEERADPGSVRAFLKADRTRWLTFILIRGGELFAYGALLYFILLGTLSLFASTRALREQVAAWATRPLVGLADRVAVGLPTLLLLLFALAVVQAGWHAISLTADRMARGKTTIAGLSPALVRPMRLLVRAALLLATPLLLVPLVTGDSAHLLARIGFLALQVLCVALIPLLATALAGLRALLGQHYRLGEWLVLWDGQRGEVCDVDLFHVRLVPDAGGQVLVPHLLALLRPVHHLPSVPPLEVDFPVPLSLPPPVAAQRLREAASAFAAAQELTGRPTVALLGVHPDHALFRVDISAAPPYLKSELLLALSTILMPAPEAPSLPRTGT